MRRRVQPSTGFEAAPDIFALPLGTLGVAVVIALSFAKSPQLPAVQLPSAAAAQISESSSAEVAVTLRTAGPEEASLEVFVENRRLEAGIEDLEEALRSSGAGAIALRAGSDVDWGDSVKVMDTALELGMTVAASVE